MSDSSRDAEWIAGLAAGRLEVFREVFDAYAMPLQQFARVWVAPDVAEDVVQDVLFDLWRRREVLEIRGTSLGAYLYSAVRHRTVKHLRHARVVARAEQDERPGAPLGMGDSPLPPDVQLTSDEFLVALRTAMASLSELQRAALLLRWTQGLSYVQIAQALEISENAAMHHVSRARHALRPMMTKYLGELE